MEYSVGFDLDDRARRGITRLGARGWEPALDADGKPRTDAHVAELTGLLRQSAGAGDQLRRPDDLRVIVRREPIPVGMQVSLFEQHDGYRYQIVATNTVGGQVQTWRPATGSTPASRTASAPRKPPACGACPPSPGESTRPGARSSLWKSPRSVEASAIGVAVAEKRKKYDREFREGAVRIVEETGKSIAARSLVILGVNEGTLGNWVNQARAARRGQRRAVQG